MGSAALRRRRVELHGLGQELAGDRVGGVRGIDQGCAVGRDGHGVARRHAAPARAGGPARSGRRRREPAGGAQGLGDGGGHRRRYEPAGAVDQRLRYRGMSKAPFRGASATGGPQHILDPCRAGRQHGQPVRTPALPRKPAASHRGAARKSSSSGLSLPVDPVLLGHLGLEAAALFGGIVSARRRRWRARPRRHRARTVPPRRGSRGLRRARAASTAGYSHRMVARPIPRLGSTFSTITLLKISAQVSSAATRTPDACTALAKASRSVSPSAWMVARRSSPARRVKALATVSRSGSAKGSMTRPRNTNSDAAVVFAARVSNVPQSRISAS